MVEKWIHRECERDVADLVQPPQHSVRGRCAVCGQTFGAVWLNEVEEAISIPIVDESGEVQGKLFVSKEAVAKQVVEEVLVAEPELEVIAVLEPEKPSRNVLSGDIDIGPLEDTIDEKEAEIAKLRAQIEALEK